jgi:hypothetical protein
MKNTMNTEQKMEALQNGLNYFNIGNLKVYKHIPNDKRKTKSKFFIQKGTHTISPALEYNELTHFILGMSRAKQLITN